MGLSYNVGGITLWNVGTLKSPVIQGIGGVPFSHLPGGYIKFSDSPSKIDNSCLCSYRYYRVFRVFTALNIEDPLTKFFVNISDSKNPYETYSDAGVKWSMFGGFRYKGCFKSLPDLKWHLYSLIPYDLEYYNTTTPAPSYYLLKNTGPATVWYMDIPSYKCCNGYAGCGKYIGPSDGTGRHYTLSLGWWCNALFIVYFKDKPPHTVRLTRKLCTRDYNWGSNVTYLDCSSAKVTVHGGFIPTFESLCSDCILSLYRFAENIDKPNCSQWYLYLCSLDGCKTKELSKWSLVTDYRYIPALILQGGGGCCPDLWHLDNKILKICDPSGNGGTLYVWVKGGLCGVLLTPPQPSKNPLGLCTLLCYTQNTGSDASWDSRYLSDSSNSRDSLKLPCIKVISPPYVYKEDNVIPQLFDVYGAKLTKLRSSDSYIPLGVATCQTWYKLDTQKDESGKYKIKWLKLRDTLNDWLLVDIILDGFYSKTGSSTKYQILIVRNGLLVSDAKSDPSRYSGKEGFAAVQDKKLLNSCEYYFQVYFTGCPTLQQKEEGLSGVTSFCCLKWRYVGRFSLLNNDLCKMGIKLDKWLPNIKTNVLGLSKLQSDKVLSVYTVKQQQPMCCLDLPSPPLKQIMCCYLILIALCLIPQKLAISKAIEKGLWATKDVAVGCDLSLTMKFGLVDDIANDNNIIEISLQGYIEPCAAFYSYKLGEYYGLVRALQLISLALLCSKREWAYKVDKCPSDSLTWRLKTKGAPGVYFRLLCILKKYLQYYFLFKGSLRCYYDPLAVKKVLPVKLDPVVITPTTIYPLTGWFKYNYILGTRVYPTEDKVIDVSLSDSCINIYYTNYKEVCNLLELVSLSLSGYTIKFPLKCCKYLCKSRYREITTDDECKTVIGDITAGLQELCGFEALSGKGFYYITRVSTQLLVPVDLHKTYKPLKCKFYYVATKKWKDYLKLPLDQSLSLSQINVAWPLDCCEKYYYYVGTAEILSAANCQLMGDVVRDTKINWSEKRTTQTKLSDSTFTKADCKAMWEFTTKTYINPIDPATLPQTLGAKGYSSTINFNHEECFRCLCQSYTWLITSVSSEYVIGHVYSCWPTELGGGKYLILTTGYKFTKTSTQGLHEERYLSYDEGKTWLFVYEGDVSLNLLCSTKEGTIVLNIPYWGKTEAIAILPGKTSYTGTIKGYTDECPEHAWYDMTTDRKDGPTITVEITPK